MLLEFRVVLDTALSAHYLQLHRVVGDGGHRTLAAYDKAVVGIQLAVVEIINRLLHIEALHIFEDLAVAGDIHRK